MSEVFSQQQFEYQVCYPKESNVGQLAEIAAGYLARVFRDKFFNLAEMYASAHDLKLGMSVGFLGSMPAFMSVRHSRALALASDRPSCGYLPRAYSLRLPLY